MAELPKIDGVFAAALNGGPAHGVHLLERTPNGLRPKWIAFPCARPAAASPEGKALGAVAAVQAAYAEYEAVGVVDNGTPEGLACYEFLRMSAGPGKSAEQLAHELTTKGKGGNDV